jgi:hypothetical protein
MKDGIGRKTKRLVCRGGGFFQWAGRVLCFRLPAALAFPFPLQAEEGRCSGERPSEVRNEKNKLINYFAADDSLRSAPPLTEN